MATLERNLQSDALLLGNLEDDNARFAWLASRAFEALKEQFLLEGGRAVLGNEVGDMIDALEVRLSALDNAITVDLNNRIAEYEQTTQAAIKKD